MFEFDGMVFTPYRNFKNEVEATTLIAVNSGIVKRDFDYEAFYKEAEKAGEVFDMYFVDGVKCIPCNRVLCKIEERKEYPLTELGYFTKAECEALKRKLDHKTYMDFIVKYSNYHGNCTLIVTTEYDAPEEEIKNFFLHTALEV